MPIGKSSIKRITNNGYSHVESKAPDMENSTVAEMPLVPVKQKSKTPAPKKSTKAKAQTKQLTADAKETEVETLEVAPVKRGPGRPRKNPTETPITKKTPAKATPKKKSKDTVSATMKPSAPKKQQQAERADVKDGFAYVNLGGELPVHLL